MITKLRKDMTEEYIREEGVEINHRALREFLDEIVRLFKETADAAIETVTEKSEEYLEHGWSKEAVEKTQEEAVEEIQSQVRETEALTLELEELADTDPASLLREVSMLIPFFFRELTSEEMFDMVDSLIVHEGEEDEASTTIVQ